VNATLAALLALRAQIDRAVEHLLPLVPILEAWAAQEGAAPPAAQGAPERDEAAERSPTPDIRTATPGEAPRPTVGAVRPAAHHSSRAPADERGELVQDRLRAVRKAGQAAVARRSAAVLQRSLQGAGEGTAHGAARGSG
jgi:hypothetical protein